jgi:signal peptidase I
VADQGTSTTDPEPYVFRPAEFRPAVFIPAHPPHPGDVPGAAHRSDHHADPSSQAIAKPAGRWSDSFARVGEELVAWMKTVVSAAVYATLIVTFGFQVARVEGQSMVPTLEDQDRLIVNKWIYRWHDPQVGDVVMLYYPEEPEKSFVKRVVAEEGDTIRSEGGRVFRNEVLLNDDFIPEEYRSTDSWGPYVVKKGYYFVMGDHRNNSSDSRTWGEVPKKYIIGKVQIRWWPLGHAKIF